jgi:hypothetical protein
MVAQGDPRGDQITLFNRFAVSASRYIFPAFTLVFG